MTRSKTLHCVFERDKGMREVDVNEIIKNIKEMCIEANHFLSKDMKEVYDAAAVEEESPLGRQILGQLQENLQIAGEDMIPICQDTGMAVVFVKVGQEVHITGGGLTDAVNEGVRQGYVDGYLRKSVVKDPIYRENTKDNTPAVIHYDIVPGDKVVIAAFIVSAMAHRAVEQHFTAAAGRLGNGDIKAAVLPHSDQAALSRYSNATGVAADGHIT